MGRSIGRGRDGDCSHPPHRSVRAELPHTAPALSHHAPGQRSRATWTDGDLPADNNWVENQIRPIAIGRSNWLFAGSLRAGKRAAAAMRLIHSARINGHDPYAYLREVLERLPTQRASQIGELLPHRWMPAEVA
jgi:hypothetical protein